MEVKTVLKQRNFKAGFIIRWELIDGTEFGCDDMVMRSAYTPNGDYIGDWKTAYQLCVKRDIKPELRTDTSKVCSIGFSERDDMWYGWSHRAIYGFAVGSTTRKGDCGYTPATVDELYDSEVNPPRNPSITPERVERIPDGVRIKHNMVTHTIEDPVTGALSGWEDAEPQYQVILTGRGEWIARSLGDAKQMAMDFAEGVG